jgi:ribosomal protein S27AE
MLGSFLYGPSVFDSSLTQRAAAADAGNRADVAARTVKDLEARIERLTLVNLAMWSFIREKTGLTEQNLLDRVREIDLQDGVIDGRMKKDTRTCSKCGRVMSARHSKCMYCGHEELVSTSFDAI